MGEAETPGFIPGASILKTYNRTKNLKSPSCKRVRVLKTEMFWAVGKKVQKN
jgi:hypothetical protein